MTDLADELAAWLFEHVHLSMTPPIDVVELARRMGVDSIKTERMFEDGRLEQDGRHATIYLRADLPPTRQRFTIAHELGHRLLLHPRAPAQRYRHRVVHDREERLCDDLAAAILLPRSWVQSHFASSPHCLASVRRLAKETSTSLSASIVRLCDTVAWSESLLRFRLLDSRWRLEAPAAVPFEIHGRIRTTPATSATLTSLGLITTEDRQELLPLQVAGAEREFVAELSVNRSVAVALLDLRAALTADRARRTVP